MKIAYVAKHSSGHNEDEDAITHALRSLGHEVQTIQETDKARTNRISGDMLLFHKWLDFPRLRNAKGLLKVFYYFDLVDFPDPTLRARNQDRMNWMKQVIPYVDLGFCTDGDWVARDKSKKLVQLLQGADVRYAGMGQGTPGVPPVLFMGTKNGGLGRSSHINHLAVRYKTQFNHVQNVHGRALADLIASSQVVVAPDTPVTDRYFSNRAFLALGFGAFLLHPYSRLLATLYTDGKELVFYRDRADLDAKIDYYLEHPEERQVIQAAGLARTMAEHTYTHRLQKMFQIIEERRK